MESSIIRLVPHSIQLLLNIRRKFYEMVSFFVVIIFCFVLCNKHVRPKEDFEHWLP